MATIGKVQNLAREFSFEWKIDNFFSLSEKCYICSQFSLAGESWYLAIYPHGRSEINTVGFTEAYLHRKLDGPPISLAWSLGVKTFEKKTYKEIQFTYVFEKAEGYGYTKFLERPELSEKKSELVPSGVLTLVCHVQYYSKSSNDAGNTVTAKCSYCNKSLHAEYVSYHEQKCLDKPMRCPACRNVAALKKWFDHECDAASVKDNTVTVKCSHCKEDLVADCVSSLEQKCLDKSIRCPTCSDEVALRNWSDHECETARLIATKKLVDDLGDILENEEHSDVTIRVKDKEFRLHRSILAGRNPYFSSMFKTDMKEKNTGVVTIDDCEPGIFKSFINFVYTGKGHALSCDNVCDFYEMADKYQENQLKAECLCYMKNKISVNSFVDFVVLALKHDEKELLQNATDLFCKKIKEIIKSVKWQNFARDYHTQANELHIKAVDYYVK